ncbi:MAG: hypothetical protein IJX76_02965 [Clostridia bacterium]|nr:hypothetical protein [Clostridia bacterium]
MQDSEFNSKSGKGDLHDKGSERNDPINAVITDLPGKENPRQPRDLPSPRRRPGEPILFDPPYDGGIDPYAPFNDIGVQPVIGRPTIDPTRFE